MKAAVPGSAMRQPCAAPLRAAPRGASRRSQRPAPLAASPEDAPTVAVLSPYSRLIRNPDGTFTYKFMSDGSEEATGGAPGSAPEATGTPSPAAADEPAGASPAAQQTASGEVEAAAVDVVSLRWVDEARPEQVAAAPAGTPSEDAASATADVDSLRWVGEAPAQAPPPPPPEEPPKQRQALPLSAPLPPTPAAAPAAEAAVPAAASSAGAPNGAANAGRAGAIERAKTRLLTSVTGLDRGLDATEIEADEVAAAAAALEALHGPVVLSWASQPPSAAAAGGSGAPSSSAAGRSTLQQLSGTWRLVYSSGFNGGSLGGRRPGPPAALSPAALGPVYQVIDPQTAKLDNVVELQARNPLALLAPFAGSAGDSLAAKRLPLARLTLRHDYEVQGGNVVRIVFEETYAQLQGSPLATALPPFAIPSLPEVLKPPRALRAATFQVTYLDDGLRVTRGDRGELRVYVRSDVTLPPVPEQY